MSETTVAEFGRLLDNPEEYKAKLFEFRDAERAAKEASAQANADIARAADAVSVVESERRALNQRYIEFDIKNDRWEAEKRETLDKLAEQRRINDERTGSLSREQAELHTRMLNVQAREAEAARLIAEGGQEKASAARVHAVASAAVREMRAVLAGISL